MSRLRAAVVLIGFVALTLPLMPVQAVLVRRAPGLARRLPHWYHRQVCRLIGLRLNVIGEVAPGPVLMVANHTSWLDIVVLSALAPVSFVAKREVGSWPFVASLARLQRTVFVDRERRATVGDTAGEMVQRLEAGDRLVLFAEGTSSDGNRVLAFRSSLFAAVKPSRAVGGASEGSGMAAGGQAGEPRVQTAAVVYTRLHGMPLGRADRPLVAWYGDMEMGAHAWQLLGAGPLDVEIRVGAPVRISAFAGRKELALETEREVREAVGRILLARPDAASLAMVNPVADSRGAGRPAGSPAAITQVGATSKRRFT